MNPRQTKSKSPDTWCRFSFLNKMGHFILRPKQNDTIPVANLINIFTIINYDSRGEVTRELPILRL